MVSLSWCILIVVGVRLGIANVEADRCIVAAAVEALVVDIAVPAAGYCFVL